VKTEDVYTGGERPESENVAAVGIATEGRISIRPASAAMAAVGAAQISTFGAD
jgi:hypothetical protein